jgi:hypothetical protein
MPRGGKQPGAGRPKEKRTIQAEKLREFLIAEVLREKGPIIEALIAKAKTGDVPAIKELLERSIGKVKETVDVNNMVSEPLHETLIRAIDKIYGKQSN